MLPVRPSIHPPVHSLLEGSACAQSPNGDKNVQVQAFLGVKTMPRPKGQGQDSQQEETQMAHYI